MLHLCNEYVMYYSCVMKKTYEYVVPLSECKHKSVIIGVGSVESSFLIQVKSLNHVSVLDKYALRL